MTTFQKLTQYLIGNENEVASWLFYFILSSVISVVLGVIVELIRLL